MARGIIRKPSFNKIVGAYRSQWKRFWMRLFTFGMYGKKGMGWWRDPKRAWYNFWYHRSSISVYRILGCKPSRGACFFAMLCASVVSIFAAPVDATRAGVTAHKIMKERKARAEGTSSRSGSSRTSTSSSSRSSSTTYSSSERTSSRTYSEPKKTTTVPRTHTSSSSSSARSTPPRSTTTNSHKTTTPRKPTTTTSIRVTPPVVEEKKKESYTYSYTPLFPKPEPAPYVPPKPEEPKEPDENTPKSKPMYEGDQYIRKRMIIAGSYYCDQSVISQLSVGTYFQVVAEPDNPQDKDAVALYYQETKIGYIAKKDVVPFVVCLKLRRNIYGVVTDIREKDGRKEIEYETWFLSKR